MKIKLLSIILLFAIMLSCLMIAACNQEETFGDWKATRPATCTEDGLEERFCLTHNGAHREERVIAATGHDFTEWETIKEPTLNDNGVKYRECKKCDYSEQEPLDPIPTKYTITIIEGVKVLSRVKVAEDGKYSLSAPQKTGYTFGGYFDEADNAFELAGVVTDDVTVSAKWNLNDTSTFEQLELYARSGVDKIHITENFEITDTVFIVSETEIFVDSNITLTRSASFVGDMFVVGENEKGDNVLNLGQNASLSLTTALPFSGTLNIDGNGKNVAASGSAVLLLNSSALNMYDGVEITNCKKTSNSKLIGGKYLISYPERIGGAAICVVNGEFNMYGGGISNCEINLDESNTSESDENLRASSCGGAIYNYGTVNIYNGAIYNNKAARGGAIYNYRDISVFSAAFYDNYASVYGGAIYLSGSQYAKTVIGNDNSDLTKVSVSFVNNASQKSGGALFGQTLNSIFINGETKFLNNSSLENNGGAINTSGALIVRNTTFESNCAQSKGGAIYAYYSNPDRTVRMVDVDNVVFQENTASKGGALAVSASQDDFDKGGVCYLNNSVFLKNNAFATAADDTEIPDDKTEAAQTDEKNYNGNGGAVYTSRKGTVTAQNCVFESNVAERRGGALYSTGNSEIDLVEENIFTSNSSARGGAMFVYDNSSVIADKVRFVNNTASQRGGALYVSSSSAVFSEIAASDNQISVKALPVDGDDTECSGAVLSAYSRSEINVKKLTASENISTGNGGVAYVSDSVVAFGEVYASGNCSLLGNGGVFAIHSSGLLTVDVINAIGNSAAEGNGGVAYVRSSQIVIGSENNAEPSLMSENASKSGGALYASVADDKVDADVVNITVYSLTVDGNTSTGNGGAIYAYSNSVVSLNNVVARNNSSNGNGGAVYVSQSAFLTVTDGKFENNKSQDKGGALYVTSKARVNVNNVEGINNSAVSGGGFLYATSSGTVVNIDGCTLEGNSSDGNGGALYFYTSCAAVLKNITAKNNNSGKYGGVIYISGAANLSVENVTARNNSAQSGGFLYITTADTVLKLYSGDLSGNTATDANAGNAIWSNTAKVKLYIKGGANGYGEYVTCDPDDIKGKAAIQDIPAEQEE